MVRELMDIDRTRQRVTSGRLHRGVRLGGMEGIDGVPAKRSKRELLVAFPKAILCIKLAKNLVFAVPS